MDSCICSEGIRFVEAVLVDGLLIVVIGGARWEQRHRHRQYTRAGRRARALAARASPLGDNGRHRADSLKESQLAAGRDLLLSAGHHRREKHNSKPRSGSAVSRDSVVGALPRVVMRAGRWPWARPADCSFGGERHPASLRV
jgi:hypothetical protein